MDSPTWYAEYRHADFYPDKFAILEPRCWWRKKSHKASRAQAFRNLLERQYIEHLKGNNKYISAMVKGLAKSWVGDRMTVVKFLTSLVQLKVLTLDTLSNK